MKPEQQSDDSDEQTAGCGAGLSLDDLRSRIDEIDRKLVAMLNERANVVVQVGNLKRSDGTPIYAPHREQAVLSKVLGLNAGPLSDRTVETIYRELMSGSFSLELPLRVGYLGPRGSFSHMAAVRHFGSSVEHLDLHTIDGVFREVAGGQANYGLVPYENSTMGSITDTLDAFTQFDVTIYAEAMIEINHHLMAACAPDEITAIHSKPQIFEQCRDWILNHFPSTPLVPESSSAAAVEFASQNHGVAAIGSALAGKIYGINSVFEHIEDHPNNITRFLVIAKQEAQRTGNDKTSIMFTTADKPGALVDVLNVFRENAINLSHIEKRPSRRTNWEYTFFIDCEAHGQDDNMRSAIEQSRVHCERLKVLGSYPRAQRTL